MSDIYTTYNLDCRDVMDLYLEENSVDAIVTDPPYGLSFMGKAWDHGVPGVEFWERALRVLKPGGHLLAFSGSRTYHRMTSAIEDAGFEIRDQIMWVYGSGFPKSHNGPWGGTALKPAHEPIVLARKPLIGTVAANVLEHGTGGLNIDGCRVEFQGDADKAAAKPGGKVTAASGNLAGKAQGGAERAEFEAVQGSGRWPANLIHDGSDEVEAAFPQAKGQQGSVTGAEPSSKTTNTFGEFAGRASSEPRGDTGSAARFFYCAKTSKRDRDEGLDGFATVSTGSLNMRSDAHAERNGNLPAPRANTHPTVKPTDLRAYLCRLVTPPGGLVLDPFMGSGSTGKAAIREGFRFIGCELETGYHDIACARLLAESVVQLKAAA